MDTVGQKIRELRLAKGQTRQDLCDDETILSVRQLVRIEKGESKPNISTLIYIANRLGVSSYQLMPDYQVLPHRYLELRYLLLRAPVYGDETSLDEKEQYLEEIFVDYYDDLPEDEQLTIDIIQATVDVYRTDRVEFSDIILEDYFCDVEQKSLYTLNDVLMVRLFFIKQLSIISQTVDKIGLQKNLNSLMTNLSQQIDVIDYRELFILRDTMLVGVRLAEILEDYNLLDFGIKILNEIMDKSKDFQKKTIILMLEWKNALFRFGNLSEAENCYQRSKMLAEMLGERNLVSMLEQEWRKDLKKYL